MFRTWTWWLTLLTLILTLGYFWLLSHDVTFTRVESGTKAPVAQGKK